MEHVPDASDPLTAVLVGPESQTAVENAGLSEGDEDRIRVVQTVSVEAADDELGAADILVPIGEAALLSLVRAAHGTPILPIDAGRGIQSVPREELENALSRVAEGQEQVHSVSTLDVRSDGERFRALMDVMAVTSEAAKISEYEVARQRDGEELVLDRIRADGMVAAAPAGTPGYVTAAGGPILDPDMDAVTVVPVGPFRIEQPHWVLELPISIQVVREEVPVSLLVDDREVGSMGAGTAVELRWGDPVEIVQTPESRSSLEDSQGGRAD